MFSWLLSVLPAFSGVASPLTCTGNNTHGCFNGVAYEFSTQFPCGAHNVYNYASDLCCEQGRPFSTTDQYCCTGSGQEGIHAYSDGKCDMNTPEQCACVDTVKQTPIVKDITGALVDTSSPPTTGSQCDGISGGGQYGCLNGYNFSFSTYAACGNYLMEYGRYGCCPSSAGFLPYVFGLMYCCKNETAPPGQDYSIGTTPCKCHRYGCDGYPESPFINVK